MDWGSKDMKLLGGAKQLFIEIFLLLILIIRHTTKTVLYNYNQKD